MSSEDEEAVLAVASGLGVPEVEEFGESGVVLGERDDNNARLARRDRVQRRGIEARKPRRVRDALPELGLVVVEGEGVDVRVLAREGELLEGRGLGAADVRRPRRRRVFHARDLGVEALEAAVVGDGADPVVPARRRREGPDGFESTFEGAPRLGRGTDAPG